MLSGGRVNWGVGRGFDRTEYQNFGVEIEDSYPRFREAVEVVLAAWSGERFTFQGEYHQFEDLEVLPKPLQSPHPPVWLAATSIGAVEWCAEHGYSILMDPHAPHADIAAKRARYQEVLEGAGYSMADRVIPMARNIALGSTLEEAEQTARQGAQFMFGNYLPKDNAFSKAKPEKTDPPRSMTDRKTGGSKATSYASSRLRASCSIMRSVSGGVVSATRTRENMAAKEGASSSRRCSCSGVHSPTSVSSPRASGPRKNSARLRSLSRVRPSRPVCSLSSTTTRTRTAES